MVYILIPNDSLVKKISLLPSLGMNWFWDLWEIPSDEIENIEQPASQSDEDVGLGSGRSRSSQDNFRSIIFFSEYLVHRENTALHSAYTTALSS